MMTYSMTFAVQGDDGARWPLFPLLMRKGWLHATTEVSLPIISDAIQEHIPHMTLGCMNLSKPDATAKTELLREARMDNFRCELSEFYAEAIHNLQVTLADWAPQPDPRLIACTTDCLAAERIADPLFMKRASEVLGDSELIVAVPARGRLYAASNRAYQSDPLFARALTCWNYHLYSEAGGRCICPRRVRMVDGQAVAMVALADSPELDAQLPKRVMSWHLSPPTSRESGIPEDVLKIVGWLNESGYTLEEHPNGMFKASHPQFPRISLGHSMGFTNLATYFGASDDSVALLTMVNELNGNSLVARYRVDSDGDFVMETSIATRPSREPFLHTLDIWHRDWTTVGNHPAAAGLLR